MRVLQGLEPQNVFDFFEQICAIPHTSHHEKALSDFCAAFAKERGLEHMQDEMGNVIIVKEATPGYEDVEPLIIQGHLDMVGDKTAECELDLEKDGLRLRVDGDLISAEGTTLGGDDGIAIAYTLAILDAQDIPHPRLEAVMTVGEEIGLLGATAIDLSMCRGKRLLNLDSEEEGVLTTGCAGGRRAHCRIPLKRVSAKGTAVQLKLAGLLGGHSGAEIDKGRANACVAMGRFLALLREKAEYGLVEFFGGVKDNVIPKSADARIVIGQEAIEALKAAVAEFERQMKAEYGTADPNIRLLVEEQGACELQALDADSLDFVLDALNLMPNGVQSMSADLPGLVETSMNMGIAELKEDALTLDESIRSSVTSAKEQMARKVQRFIRRLGGSVEFSGDYPAWPYAKDSKLREICVEIFEKQYHRKPEVMVIHAGLECGILSDKIPGLDCVSLGPDLLDIHTPQERMSISSVARTWEYLKAILAHK